MENKRANERGNVMFYILIAVALMAALIFAVGQSGRGSIQGVNQEKARILASEIIDYSNTIATAYAQLRLRGCKLAEMSFENTVDLNYTNAGAPADKSCHLFELAGGGITFKLPPVEALTGVGKQMITGELEIEEVGTTCAATTCAELLLASGPFTKTVCDQINTRLKVNEEGDATPIDAAEFMTRDEFVGAMNFEANIGTAPTAGAIFRKTAACLQDSDDTFYYFYKILATN